MPEAGTPDWDDPLWSRVPLPHERRARALGLDLRLRTNAPAIAALFEAAFGDDPVPTDEVREHGGPDLCIEAATALDAHGQWRGRGRGEDATSSERAAAEDRSVGAVEHHAPGRSFHRERGALYTAGDDRGSVVCADLAGGRAAAFVAGECRMDIARLVLLESPVWRLATWRGMVALHAAALRIDGLGVMLRGAPGAGKSTLAAAALTAGHGVLADEVTWWDPNPTSGTGGDSRGKGSEGNEASSAPGEVAQLRGVGRWIHVESELATRFPELVLAREDAPGKPRDKIALAVPANQSVTRASPGPLVLLERDGGTGPKRSSWQALAPEAASQRFEDMRIRGEGSQPPSSFAAARDALATGGAYALRAGSPSEAIGALEEIVMDWRRRFRALGANHA